MFQRSLQILRDGILSITYPQSCHICKEPVESHYDGITCDTCWRDPSVTTLLFNASFCQKCGDPFLSKRQIGNQSPDAANKLSSPNRRCGNCEALPFDYARACGTYTGALEAHILFLKSHPYLCGRLVSVIAEALYTFLEQVCADVVIPIPLHRSRERERGFNQATLVSKVVSKCLGLPLDIQSLVREKRTERHRAGMDVMDRRRSVAGAFSVMRPRVVEGATALLVDDVYTTGSTVAAAAEALVAAGASNIRVFTLARVQSRSA